MRKQKYRVWDKLRNEFLSAGTVSIEIHRGRNPEITISLDKIMDITKDHRFVIMQYTGLKDKKRTKEFPEGQEIYEGDIVRYLDDMQYIVSNEKEYLVGEVKFIDGAFWCFYEDEENLTRLVSVMVEYWSEELKENQCEIIGNIKENPQLLEKK